MGWLDLDSSLFRSLPAGSEEEDPEGKRVGVGLIGGQILSVGGFSRACRSGDLARVCLS